MLFWSLPQISNQSHRSVSQEVTLPTEESKWEERLPRKCRVLNQATGPAKRAHAIPQTPRSIPQPHIHMDSSRASPSRGRWGNWGVEDFNLPSTWDPCVKDTKNKLVNIAVYRNRNHFCFQRPLTIPVLDTAKTATPDTRCKVRPGGWVRHQSPSRPGAPQAPENSSFTSLLPGKGESSGLWRVGGVHPFSSVPRGCLEATLPLSG